MPNNVLLFYIFYLIYESVTDNATYCEYLNGLGFMLMEYIRGDVL